MKPEIWCRFRVMALMPDELIEPNLDRILELFLFGAWSAETYPLMRLG